MASIVALRLIAAAALSAAAFAQTMPETAALPSDPLEIVNGHVRAVQARGTRTAVARFLGRARNNYVVRSSGRAYDLKVDFTVNSGGQTEYDGAWKMEDIFDPAQGHRWTATAAAGYSITRISSHGMLYGDENSTYVPLRLHEARAALFDPMPAASRVTRSAIRTSTAVYNGTQLTCVLLADAGAADSAGRRWDETEECIDPQTGLLQVHSQVPGRYYAYDYSNAVRLGDHLLPGLVTVTEGGKVITKIKVDSLTELAAADPSLFVPTEEMKARGRAVALTGAEKISVITRGGPSAAMAPATTPICVFGVVTPSGELAEAHSLQPSDPRSQAAVEAAKQMSFVDPSPPGPQPQQHFVFIIEKFAP